MKFDIIYGLGLLQLFAGCQLPAPRPIDHGLGTYRDSVLETGRIMYRLVPVIDSVGRANETLPSSLESIINPGKSSSRRDVWRQELSYTVTGSSFELRSAGRDGLFTNHDDIVILGRLGRDRPCELYDEHVHIRYEGVAPLCSEVPISVLPTCPAADTLTLFREQEIGPARHDSVMMTGQFVVRLARRVDAMGRRLGGLPPMPLPINAEILVDAWGRRVHYTLMGKSFEVRSSGPDGILGNNDDILVKTDLGVPIACTFTSDRKPVECEDPTPPCARDSA